MTNSSAAARSFTGSSGSFGSFGTSAPVTLDDVAVLLPAYNGQTDIERTLASFSEDAPVHVLIVDDGSTPPIVAPAVPNLKIEVLRDRKSVV